MESWASLIRAAIEDRLLHVHTMLPARIDRYEAGRCDVTPLAKRAFLDGSGERSLVDLPPLSDVPVQFPGGGGWEISWPLQTGDEVALIFAERSIDEWKGGPAGETYDPADARHHHLSDAVAYPGLSRAGFRALDGAALRIGRADRSIEIELRPDDLGGTVSIAGGKVRLASANGPAVRGNLLDPLLDAIVAAVKAAGPGGPAASDALALAINTARLAGLVATEVLV